MKKILCIALCVIMALSGVGVLAADGLEVTLNGTLAEIDGVVIEGDEVYLPLRSLCEVCQFELGWDNDEQMATVTFGNDVTYVKINGTDVKKNEMTTTVENTAKLINDVTYVSTDVMDVIGVKAVYNEEEATLALSVDYLANKYYRMVQKSTGNALSIENGAVTDGALTIMEPSSDAEIQVWKLSPRGNGVYQPINLHSRRSFDVPNGNKDAGVRLIQYGSTLGDHQFIRPIKNEDGTYYLQFFHSDLYMTVSEEGYISQEELVGDESQTFELVEAEVLTEEVAAIDTTKTETAPLNTKSFNIVAADNKALAADATKAALTMAEVSASDSDTWRLVAQGKGKYAAVNIESGKALTNEQGKVQQQELTYADQQTFEFAEKDGKYTISQGNLYLTKNGDNLTFSQKSEVAEQAFALKSPVLDASKYGEDSFGGKYIKITNVITKKVLSIENESIDNSARLYTVEPTDSEFQIWSAVAQGNNMYSLNNKVSNRSADVPGNSIDNKVYLTQYTSNYGNNQIFEFVLQDDGTYLIKNKNSGLYLTVRSNYITQEYATNNKLQRFNIDVVGDSDVKMIGAAATLFVLKGEDTVTNAKVQWNIVNGATMYEVYRSVDGGDFELMETLSGTTVDDYDLEIGKEYSYAIYAVSDGNLIDYVETKSVEPYYLPADLSVSNNLEESGLNRPETPYSDGKYYHFQSWGRDDGGSGFGRVMMQYSEDGVTYTPWEEVMNYTEILEHETCKDFGYVRFESNNFVYNRKKNIIAYIAHLEADGGYGTAMTSIATATPGGKFTFHGAYRPEGDDTRDLNVFVDDDYSAYIMAAVHNNADLALYKLTDDWSGIERRVCYVNRSSWRELPSMIKVDGIYYLFTSGTAGWYPTQGMYNSATNIEGPWSPLRAVGNTSTFSSQSGTMFRLNSESENYFMSTYRWMYFWKDAVVKRTTNRRYPVNVSNGYAFYDFFEELLYNSVTDVLVPVQNGRILSQNMPATASKNADTANYVNDGGYRTYWYGDESWPFTWEVDLGKVSTLSQLQVSWLIWNGSEPYYQYRLEGSNDGVTYKTILDNQEGYTDYGFTVDQLNAQARYVRLVVTDANARSTDENIYPAQLYEVKILGE